MQYSLHVWLDFVKHTEIVKMFISSVKDAVAWWLEWLPGKREVMGSIPGCDRLKSLKLVVVTFPLSSQDYGNSTRTDPPVLG